MVGLLHLAARANCETALGEQVAEVLLEGNIPSLTTLQQFWGIVNIKHYPLVDVAQHALESYNQLIPAAQEICHAVY